jgi:4-amino-4-deoxy-L-arabinose transferase-like glycosyltransferase
MVKKLLFAAILALAVFLRFNQLGTDPPSLDWDEASTGYNAYALLLTGHDEYGYPWPISIRSFGDFKPPGYTYLDILPIAIFGLTEFAVRLPSAIFGSLTLISAYFLTKEFFKKNREDEPLDQANTFDTDTLALLAMFVYAIAPWPLQFSRAAFEGNIAVFFVTTGMVFLLRWLRTQKNINLILAALVLATSLYIYHAARLVVPVMLLGVALRYRQTLLKNMKVTAPATIIALLILAPLAYSFTRGSDAARFSSVSIFKPTIDMLQTVQFQQADEESGHSLLALLHNRRIEYAKQFISGYLDHYNIMYMFLIGDVVGRHHAPGVGLFYLVELIFIAVGIFTLIKLKFNAKFIFIWWALIGPLPAAISTGTPHAIRSILLLPIPHITIALGIYTTYRLIPTRLANIKSATIDPILLKAALITIFTLMYTASFTYYLIHYYVHQPVEYANEWQYGYKQMVDEVEKVEQNYDHIIITSLYDQPYIYFLFYKSKRYDPRVFINNGQRDRGWNNYEFRKIKWEEDRHLPNTLLVGGPDEVPTGEPGQIATITYPNGKDVFRLVGTGK